MSEISDFILKANKNIIKKTIEKMIEDKCKEYEPEFVKKFYHYENNKLVGLLIYFDWEKTRYILEGHTSTKNRMVFYKHWRNLFKDKNISCWKATVQKVNLKMINFYLKMHFKIIAQDNLNIFFEYRR